MPELPEVETVRRGLDKLIVGRQVKQVTSDNPRSFPNTETDVRLFLVSSTVKSVRRRAKVLMIDLSTNYTLVIHLKMTGQMVYVGHHSDRSASSAIVDRHVASLSAGPDSQFAPSSPEQARVEAGAAPLTATHAGAITQSSHPNDGLVESNSAEDVSQGVTTSGAAPDSANVIIRESGADRPGVPAKPVSWGVNAGPASMKADVRGGEQSEIRFGAGHPSDSLIGKLPDKSTRVTINFNDDTNLFFNDQRKFGWMKLLPTAEVPNIDFMRKVGPEPLESNFSPEQFQKRFLRRARTSIKAALLDQTVIAGIGNIYADESLWMSKIHPLRLVGSISNDEFESLYHSVRDVMSLSIEKGGSTDRNYVDAEGRRGSYMDFANVFRREGQACNRCGNEIIKTRVAGRGTHICPVCQIL